MMRFPLPAAQPASLDELRACYGSRDHFEYSFHISPSPAFVYVNNPKCGCTTAKASLNRWYAAAQGRTLDYGSMGEIHDRAFNPLLRPARLGEKAAAFIMREAGVFRFTVLRDPVARLASAYANKLSWNSSERRKFNLAAGRPAEAPLPAGLFISLIGENRTLRDLDEHWRAQYLQTAAAFVPYDFVCLQETLAEDLLSVRDRLFPGLALGVFDARASFPGNRSDSAGVLATLDQDQRRQVAQIYAEDTGFIAAVRQSRAAVPERG